MSILVEVTKDDITLKILTYTPKDVEEYKKHHNQYLSPRLVKTIDVDGDSLDTLIKRNGTIIDSKPAERTETEKKYLAELKTELENNYQKILVVLKEEGNTLEHLVAAESLLNQNDFYRAAKAIDLILKEE